MFMDQQKECVETSRSGNTERVSGTSMQLSRNEADASRLEMSVESEHSEKRNVQDFLGAEFDTCRSGSDGQLLDSIPKISSQEKRTSAGTPAPSICSICGVHQQRFAVKFPCCSEYFHSFLCHNLSESCSKKDLRPFDGQFLKCLDCKGNQKFTNSSQHCENCGIKFAEYFCDHCKLLTTADESLYHCDKCGLCRYLYFKDVVSLKINLLNGHTCRPGFDSDPCCICCKDTPGGWQILPCSHKVHIICGKKRIEMGMRCCFICRGPAPL